MPAQLGDGSDRPQDVTDPPASGSALDVRSTSKVKGGAGLLVAGVAAQAATLAAMSLVTRRIGRDEFGTAALALSAGSLLGACGAGTYDAAIVVASSRREARLLLDLSLRLLVAVSVVVLAVVLVLSGVLDGPATLRAHWFAWAPAVALLVGATGAGQAVSYAALRESRFRVVAVARTVAGVGTAAFTLIAVETLPPAVGLVIAAALGQCAGVVPLALWRRAEGRGARPPSRRRLWAAARRRSDFPRYVLPQSLVDVAREMTIALILTVRYGPADYGAFSLADRVLRTPVGVVGGAVGQATFSAVAEDRRRGARIGPTFVKVTAGLAVLGLVGAAAAFLFGRPMFALVFGPEMAAAGDVARVVGVWYALMLACSHLPGVCQVLGKQRLYFRVGFAYGAAVVVVAVAVATSSWPFLDAVGTLAVAGVVGLSLAVAAVSVWVRRADRT